MKEEEKVVRANATNTPEKSTHKRERNPPATGTGYPLSSGVGTFKYIRRNKVRYSNIHKTNSERTIDLTVKN
jgi:hypothetical protein